MKRNVVLGLLIVLLVLIFIGCGENEDNNPKIYTVNIGTLANANGSTITAYPTSGVEGTEITLTVNVEDFYQLKTETLKYGSTTINETTLKFNLPAANVIITAEFEHIANDIFGIWYSLESDQYPNVLTINENIFDLIHDQEYFVGRYTIENITNWEFEINNNNGSIYINGINKNYIQEFPNGFSITGTVTYDENMDTNTINILKKMYIFINNEKTMITLYDKTSSYWGYTFNKN